MYLTPIGEDTLLICEKCSYTANRQVARFRKAANPSEKPRPIEKVHTPGAHTIEALAEFLKIPSSKTAKALLLMAEMPTEQDYQEQFIFAVLRGDMDLNETKLVNALQARSLRPASDDEIRAAGTVPGFASPLGLKDVTVVVDEAVVSSPNLVAGANEVDYHLRNVNYERDYQAAIVADIAAANEGHPCPECGSPMKTSRGVELGNIFQLGTRYSQALGATFLDQDGKAQPVIMGSYGIGVGRLLACVAEEYHDQHGLIWPITVAPFQVHLVVLKGAEETAERLYPDLLEAGFEVLYDDRPESPGVKFNDADLIGIPIRLTVSERALAQGGIEFKLRHIPERTIIPRESLIAQVASQVKLLESEIAARIKPMPYNG
jgi:prolyl-tRNA synthetase